MNPNIVQALPYYKKIQETIDRLSHAGLLIRMQGNCVSSCDLVQNLLHQVGIKSRIVEVQLTVTKYHGETTLPDHLFIGYDNLSFGGQVDTHTVVITDTEYPLLIDLSIAHVLENKKYVLEVLDDHSDFILDRELDSVKLTYQLKKTPRLPAIHQKTLLDRIIEEQQSKETMKWLKLLVAGTLGLTVINFMLNSVLLVLKVIFH